MALFSRYPAICTGIPRDTIYSWRIKQTVPIERLCSSYSIDLKAQGKNLVSRCPFHQDDIPSFIVIPEKNLWHCMGACDEGGNVFNLVMKAEKVSFPKAYKILSELSGDAPAGHTVTTCKVKAHPILVAPDTGGAACQKLCCCRLDRQNGIPPYVPPHHRHADA